MKLIRAILRHLRTGVLILSFLIALVCCGLSVAASLVRNSWGGPMAFQLINLEPMDINLTIVHRSLMLHYFYPDSLVRGPSVALTIKEWFKSLKNKSRNGRCWFCKQIDGHSEDCIAPNAIMDQFSPGDSRTVDLAVLQWKTGVWYGKRSCSFWLPLPVLAFAAGISPTLVWTRSLRRKRLIHKGCCIKCGYNLKGLTERRCPECGTEF